MLIECRECKKKVSDKSAYCLNCGCPSVWAVELAKAQAELWEAVLGGTSSKMGLFDLFSYCIIATVMGVGLIIGLIVGLSYLCEYVGTYLAPLF